MGSKFVALQQRLEQRSRMGRLAPVAHYQRVKGLKRTFRADRRNAQFGRKPQGNTTPAQRQVIWAITNKARTAKAA